MLPLMEISLCAKRIRQEQLIGFHQGVGRRSLLDW